jgi:hypothetical protein
MAMADGNRLRAALLLDRWAGILKANDPGLAADLGASAKSMVKRDIQRVRGRYSRKSWRFR